jgi:Ca2+-binding EF-hand superfamily protein
MKITTKLIQPGLIVAVAIALLPVSAYSEGFPGRGPIPYFAFDKDNNGFISEQEFNEVRGERRAARAAEGRPMRGAASAPAYSALDTNGDGQLSREELIAGQRAHMKQRHAMRMSQGRDMAPDRGMGRGMERGMGRGMGRHMPFFSEFDVNRDGILLEKEFEEARSKRMAEMAQRGHQMKHAGKAPSFADIDTNSNGKVDMREFSVHQSQCRRNMQGRGAGQERGMGRGMAPDYRMEMDRDMNRGRGMGRNMPFFSEFDLNRDRMVSEKEFNEARSIRMAERAKQGYQMRNAGKSHSFADIDTNGDGGISMREFSSHQAKRYQQRMQ